MKNDGSTYVRGVCAAFKHLRDELAREDRPPTPLVFPNPEWKRVNFGHYDVIFRRPETLQAAINVEKRIEGNSDWSERWSSWEIRRVIGSALGEAALSNLSPDQTLQHVTNAAAELDAPAEEWLYYYIAGGVFFSNEIKLGPFRAFRLIDDEYEAMAKTFRDTLNSTAHTVEEKEAMLEQRLADLKPLNGMACVEVRVTGGDMRFRLQLAEERLEEVLDFFQILHEDHGGWPPGAKIVARELPFNVAPIPMIRSDRAATNWQVTFEHMHRATISAEMVAKAKTNDLRALVVALEKLPEERGDFERALLNAMHWIADARRQPAPELQLTDAITALEMFFTTDQPGTPISRDVSEGVALIVGKTLDQRRRIKERVQDLYNKRSKVSHAGKREITNSELYEVRNLVMYFLRKMCKLAPLFKKRVDVRAWLENLRLSASYDDPKPDESADTDAVE